MPKISLVGNPNSGKTTVFNALTGAHQKVGNWPGVTVEQKSGQARIDDRVFEFIDLPGLYDLNEPEGDTGLDTQITRKYLEQRNHDLLINVIDASCLARSLFNHSTTRQRPFSYRCLEYGGCCYKPEYQH